MILSDMLKSIDARTGYGFCIAGKDAVAAACMDQHPVAIVGDILKMIAQSCACENEQCEVVRERAVTAMGPIRLKYMADDAPVEGLRIVENTVLAIDAAFDEEALDRKRGI